MIQLRSFGAQLHRLDTDFGSILFSYGTPIAVEVGGIDYRLADMPSVTSAKHATVAGYKSATKVTKEVFSDLLYRALGVDPAGG
jgi:hypothetical protein